MSQRHSEYIRQDNEAYFTPPWVTLLLLQKYRFNHAGGVYDPCCGDGQIVKACQSYGLKSDGQDLFDYGFRPKGVDFLSMSQLPDGFENIFMNPPYGYRSSLSVQFIEHSLKLISKTGGILAVLLKVNFDSAKTRDHLFDHNEMFAAEIRLKDRIRWTNLEQTASGPSENHSWFVWDARNQGRGAQKLYASRSSIMHLENEEPETMQWIVEQCEAKWG